MTPFEEFKLKVKYLAEIVDEHKLDVIQADGILVQKTKHQVMEEKTEVQPKTDLITAEDVAEMSWSLSHAGRY